MDRPLTSVPHVTLEGRLWSNVGVIPCPDPPAAASSDAQVDVGGRKGQTGRTEHVGIDRLGTAVEDGLQVAVRVEGTQRAAGVDSKQQFA